MTVMLLLIQIDLTSADLVLFERYQDAALALMPEHGAVMERRLRASDGSSETHLVRFPDDRAFHAFVSDPRRLALSKFWSACGAKAERWTVEDAGA